MKSVNIDILTIILDRFDVLEQLYAEYFTIV